MPNSQSNIVAFAKCPAYSNPQLKQTVYTVLEAAKLTNCRGKHILVKPNLLMAKHLACVDPHIVVHTCEWLIDQGANITVADSPGFGTASYIAHFLGLDEMLKPLGIHVSSLDQPVNIRMPLKAGNHKKEVTFKISRKALECDILLSVAKIKAHKQMRMTLCVKNCFGCITGLQKALIHARYGESTEFFADCIAQLWAHLPPIAGVIDGITAMHVTGPADGQPYHLGLVGAASAARYLDTAILSILSLQPDAVPLEMALRRLTGTGENQPIYPLENPEAFNAAGFVVPQELASASFRPGRLIKSFAKRIWKNIYH